MTIEEIQAANEEADKQREAEMTAQGMTDALASNQSPVPVVDKTLEQVAADQAEADLIAAVKVRQQALVDSVKALVEALVADVKEFTVDELGWASDAFKNLLTIRTTATVEHDAFAKVTKDAQDTYYSLKAKDLTVIPYEVSADKAPEVAPTDSPSGV